MLREVWHAIYAQAQTLLAQTPQGGAADVESTELVQCALRLPDPDSMMVYVMNLLDRGMPPLLHYPVARAVQSARSTQVCWDSIHREAIGTCHKGPTRSVFSPG